MTKRIRCFLLIIMLFSGRIAGLMAVEIVDETCNLTDTLEMAFLNPPRSAHPHVLWWWLNSYINREGVTRDLEEMKRNGIGGALIFDAAPVDRWEHKDIGPVPAGPPFISPEWRDVFRHAIKETDRLDLELGVSMTSGFNAGGPWVTPEYGQQELVWSQTVLEGPLEYSGVLSLPSDPIYNNQGELITYGEMSINNDLIRDRSGNPLYYVDVAVLAIPITKKVLNDGKNKSELNVPQARLKNWALKSVHSFDYMKSNGFCFDQVYENDPDLPYDRPVSIESVIDLSDRFDQSGHLNWEVPKGSWLILRFGHTHTGIMLQATNPANQGLAMNHLSAEAAEKHFEEIAKKMLADIDSVNGKNLNYFYLDSWEVRIANWTQKFMEEFHIRRGYEIKPYLPVLAGFIVESREISNRFLHDYRETIGDCIADNYYGQFRSLCHANGLEFRSEIATTPIPVDMLKCLGRCDIPVGEFWAETGSRSGRVEPWERMFGKQAASAAHIYGSAIASAEALTVANKHWEHSPFELKRTLDQCFCSGINRIMIHTFTHSPEGAGLPGYEYFAGTHFNPQITWWKQARAFTDYISRCQFLLQQGHFVADVCNYQGDRIPNFVSMKHIDPELGLGYDYDIVNSEIILTRMSVRDGKIMLPDGMSYRVLVLSDSDRINPDVLEKIDELVLAGATVIGKKPQKACGLSHYPDCDSIVIRIADKIWGDCQGNKERQYGKGRIIWGRSVREVLIHDGVLPDLEYKGQCEDSRLDYIHRSVSSSSNSLEIFFVANLMNRAENFKISFRVADQVPEIWDPYTGEIRRTPVYIIKDGCTELPLLLPPLGSVFVVFRENQSARHITQITFNNREIFPLKSQDPEGFPDLEIWLDNDNQFIVHAGKPGHYRFTDNSGKTFGIKVNHVPMPVPLTEPWHVYFPEGWGAPDSVVFDQLISWTESDDPGIKYFSGTATYRSTFSVDKADLRKTDSFFLDLGELKDLAEVTLNGKDMGVLWKPPYRVNVTSVLMPGTNNLTIRVTNLWPNRLIGDQFLPEKERYTFTNIKKFTKDSPLRESGLMGPVCILIVKRKSFKF